MSCNANKWDDLSDVLSNDPEGLLKRYRDKKNQEKIIEGKFKFHDDTNDSIARVLNKPKYEGRIKRYIILSKAIDDNWIIKLIKRFFG